MDTSAVCIQLYHPRLKEQAFLSPRCLSSRLATKQCRYLDLDLDLDTAPCNSNSNSNSCSHSGNACRYTCYIPIVSHEYVDRSLSYIPIGVYGC